MAVSRAILLKFAPFLDIGTVSALVMISAATGPVILYWMIQWTGYGKFLFHRPNWAWIDGERGNTKARFILLNNLPGLWLLRRALRECGPRNACPCEN